ncbi:MAG: aminomethyl-transferring glycine dehydrogenase subunit GcvPB, partial [Candidatus Brocadiia bacterium]
LHKTFSTPHGGGGPGSGPVAVSERLVPYLPSPTVELFNGKYLLNNYLPFSIGPLMAFYGNFAIILRAFVYILTVGGAGMKAVSEDAVLNANYLRAMLSKRYKVAHDRICMHEFVLSNTDKAEKHCPTLAIAKRLLDYGIHPPTIYFPMIVKEAMMIEPTETESKETLDDFVEIMNKIADEIETNPELLANAPNSTVVRKLDEVRAAKKPVFRFCQG